MPHDDLLTIQWDARCLMQEVRRQVLAALYHRHGWRRFFIVKWWRWKLMGKQRCPTYTDVHLAQQRNQALFKSLPYLKRFREELRRSIGKI